MSGLALALATVLCVACTICPFVLGQEVSRQMLTIPLLGTSGTTFTTEDKLPLSAGARIYDIFHRTFGRSVEGIHALEGLDDNTILEEIYNAAGPRPSLFVPESAFEAVAKRQIRKLEAPGEQGVVDIGSLVMGQSCHETILSRCVKCCLVFLLWLSPMRS